MVGSWSLKSCRFCKSCQSVVKCRWRRYLRCPVRPTPAASLLDVVLVEGAEILLPLAGQDVVGRHHKQNLAIVFRSLENMVGDDRHGHISLSHTDLIGKQDGIQARFEPLPDRFGGAVLAIPLRLDFGILDRAHHDFPDRPSHGPLPVTKAAYSFRKGWFPFQSPIHRSACSRIGSK